VQRKMSNKKITQKQKINLKKLSNLQKWVFFFPFFWDPSYFQTS
jgi:hypothetical protein